MQTKNEYLKRTLAFQEHFQKKIIPILRAYEIDRKKLLKKLILILCGLVFPGLLLILLIFSDIFIILKLKNYLDWIIPILFFLPIISCIYYETWLKDMKIFKKAIKENCIPWIINVFENIKWKKADNFTIFDNIKEMNDSGLFPTLIDYVEDDWFVGVYKGIHFRVVEVRSIPIFKGIVILINLNKNIPNRTIVSSKNNLINKNNCFIILFWILLPIILLGGITVITREIIEIIEKPGLWVILILYYIRIGLHIPDISNRKKEAFEEVKLEDPCFDKKFNVYSSDQIEARCLITPSFMERFQNLKTAFKSNKIKCSFYDTKMMIAISTKENLFEIGSLFKNLENPNYINKFYTLRLI